MTNGKVIYKPDFFKHPRIINPKALKQCLKLHPICRVCLSDKDVSPHHIQFRSEGGNDILENLISLCFNCHRWAHDGGYVTVNGKEEYVNARNFMINFLIILNDKRYEKVLEYLRSKHAD